MIKLMLSSKDHPQKQLVWHIKPYSSLVIIDSRHVLLDLDFMRFS